MSKRNRSNKARNPVARAPQVKGAHTHKTDVYASHSIKRRRAKERLNKDPFADSPLQVA